jgi:predicted PhzF superfamily epimerase YddE/YHI9
MDQVVLEVIRVFTAPDGSGGNALGVFLDGPAIEPEQRQAVAGELGFSETVFVDDPANGVIRIFTPGAELAFAGHPSVGTSWLLAERGMETSVLHPPAGVVATWREGELTWIRAHPHWIHPITIVELASPVDVEALAGPPSGETSWYPWAWIDRADGTLRSRYFFEGAGITEDEATGAAAVRMGELLGRPLEIHQGRGSVLHVRPGPGGTVEVGGRCAFVESRPYP